MEWKIPKENGERSEFAVLSNLKKMSKKEFILFSNLKYSKNVFTLN